MVFLCRKSRNIRIEMKKEEKSHRIWNGKWFIWNERKKEREREKKSERIATLELMKYSVNGNHLNTHIVNMCCCNAINRVLITALILSFATATCLRSHSIWRLNLNSSGSSSRMPSREMLFFVCFCMCDVTIGRNSTETSNRQLLFPFTPPELVNIELLNHKREQCVSWLQSSNRKYLCEFVNFLLVVDVATFILSTHTHAHIRSWELNLIFSGSKWNRMKKKETIWFDLVRMAVCSMLKWHMKQWAQCFATSDFLPNDISFDMNATNFIVIALVFSYLFS